MIENNKLSDVLYSLNYIVDDIVVGFIKYEVLFETVNIVDVLVREEDRNKGIATKLFGYLFSNLSPQRFMLEVNENNLYAKKLYENFGFKVIHVRKKYYKDADAFIMEAKV